MAQQQSQTNQIRNLEIYCCESDSKLEKLSILETVNLGPEWCCLGPEFALFFWPGSREKSAPELHNSGPELSKQKKIVTYFGPDLFQLKSNKIKSKNCI